MSDKPVKINLPKDPVVIGHTKEGEPIWLDMKDLIPTPDEDLERWDKTLDSQHQAMIDNAANVVLLNACLFLEDTVIATANSSLRERFLKTPPDKVEHLLLANGYTVIQDGLKTIVKLKGRILREMTAQCDLRWRDHVSERVNAFIRQRAKQANCLN